MIDLNEKYGKRFKVTLDESWGVEVGRKDTDKIWYLEIVGRRGRVYPMSDKGVVMDMKHSIWGKFQRSGQSRFGLFIREADDFVSLYVRNEDIEKAVRFIHARRRRVLSEAQKAALASASAKFRFKPGARDVPEAKISTITPNVGNPGG